MNSIIVLPEELNGGEAVIRGSRAKYIYEFHDLSPNITIRAALLGGAMGEAEVLHVSENEIRLSCKFHIPPPNRKRTNLLVAVSRPQTIKKVLQLSAMTGISKLILVKTELTDKSYMQSKSLYPDAVQQELVKGIEQVYDSLVPEIQILNKLSLAGDEIVKVASDTRLLLEPNAEKNLSAIQASNDALWLACGPELGWSASELSWFSELDFVSLTMGKRVYRVEIALSIALGALGRF